MSFSVEPHVTVKARVWCCQLDPRVNQTHVNDAPRPDKTALSHRLLISSFDVKRAVAVTRAAGGTHQTLQPFRIVLLAFRHAHCSPDLGFNSLVFPRIFYLFYFSIQVLHGQMTANPLIRHCENRAGRGD